MSTHYLSDIIHTHLYSFLFWTHYLTVLITPYDTFRYICSHTPINRMYTDESEGRPDLHASEWRFDVHVSEWVCMCLNECTLTGKQWAVRAHAQTYLHIKVHAHSFLFMRRWSSLGAWAHLGACMSYLIIRLTSFGLILVPTSCTGIAHLHVCFCMSSNESASHMRRRSAWVSHQNVIDDRMSANHSCA